MSLDDPVVITCSISGSLANRDQCPAIPYTPEEYGAEARRAVEEGAVMIHIHARTPAGVPSYEIEAGEPVTVPVTMLVDSHISPLYYATVEATEAAIVNCLLAAETTTGRGGATAHGLEPDLLLEAMRRFRAF